MLQITVPAVEGWDEENERFVTLHKEQTLQLEHSLISLAKWESKWCKPYLSKVEKTDEEILDYIKCMTLTQNVSDDIYTRLGKENIEKIEKYIKAPMTATTFSDDKGGKGGRRVITAEIIYHWMIALNIPVDFQKWHLNRLITLIRVCNIENSPKRKRSTREIMSQNAALNAARRKQYNTRG